jgi:hypothetical protein
MPVLLHCTFYGYRWGNRKRKAEFVGFAWKFEDFEEAKTTDYPDSFGL